MPVHLFHFEPLEDGNNTEHELLCIEALFQGAAPSVLEGEHTCPTLGTGIPAPEGIWQQAEVLEPGT